MLSIHESMLMAMTFFASLLLNLVSGAMMLYRIWQDPDARAAMIILASTVLMGILETINLIHLFINPTMNVLAESLPCISIIIAFVVSLFVLLYAIEVSHPQWLKWKHVFIGIGIWVIMIVLCVFIRFTPLYGAADIITQIREPNVWMRLVLLGMCLTLTITTVSLPYNRWSNRTSRPWRRIFFSLVIIQAVLSTLRIITGEYAISLMLEWGGIAYLSYVTYSEFFDMIPLPKKPIGTPTILQTFLNRTPEESSPAIPDAVTNLCPKLCEMIHKEVFRDPDLDIHEVAKELATNRAYLQQAVKEHSGMSFHNFINSERIRYAKQLMDENPQADKMSILYQAGFRSSSTALRNFKKYAGCTPSEYVLGGCPDSVAHSPRAECFSSGGDKI